MCCKDLRFLLLRYGVLARCENAEAAYPVFVIDACKMGDGSILHHAWGAARISDCVVAARLYLLL